MAKELVVSKVLKSGVNKNSPPFIDLSEKQKYWMTLLIDLYLISTPKVS